MENIKLETVTLAGGCFWCTEAIFKRLKGVLKVTPGYANSNIKNPTYQEVASGTTGAAEAIEIEFDPNIISLEKLLEVFFALHDPTSLNKQGNDEGTQYRSAIFYISDQQKEIAEKLKKYEYVTEITPLDSFYPADDSHKDFYDQNRNAPYCRIIIDPKITKLYKKFSTLTS